MLTKKLYIFIFFFLFIFANNLNSIASENKILIKVNNEIISSYDLFIEISYLSTININLKNLQPENYIEIAKNSLIREKIKEIELKKILETIEIESDQLDAITLNYFKRFGINSLENFNNYFLERKIDPEIIRKKITIEILWNQLIYSKFNDKIKIDRKLIEKEIKKNNVQKEYLLSEILFNLKENEKLENKFNQIKFDISEKGFGQAALIYSLSDTSKTEGKLGWVKSSVLSKEIEKNLSTTNVGNITDPIVLPGGFLILKIEDLRESIKENDIEKEVDFIIKKKTEQQLNQFSNIHLKKLTKDIQINEL